MEKCEDDAWLGKKGGKGERKERQEGKNERREEEKETGMVALGIGVS